MFINKEIIERCKGMWLKHILDIEKQIGKEWKITECFDLENCFYICNEILCDNYDENNINKL